MLEFCCVRFRHGSPWHTHVYHVPIATNSHVQLSRLRCPELSNAPLTGASLLVGPQLRSVPSTMFKHSSYVMVVRFFRDNTWLSFNQTHEL
jgi:hypothetical protein